MVLAAAIAIAGTIQQDDLADAIYGDGVSSGAAHIPFSDTVRASFSFDTHALSSAALNQCHIGHVCDAYMACQQTFPAVEEQISRTAGLVAPRFCPVWA